MNPLQCKQFRIEGRVQGVFYRAHTQRMAQELGLTGFARNEADGSVTVVACGTELALLSLADWLWEGSPASEVSAVIEQPCGVKTFNDFTTL